MKLLHMDDTMLMAFADNQLDEATAAQVRAAAASSTEIAERIELFRSTAAVVRALHTEPRPADLPAQLRRSTGRTLLMHRVGGWSRAGLPIAAAVAGLLFGMYAMPRLTASPSGGVDYMLAEVTEYHAVYARETTHLVELPAAQKSEIESWLGARVGLKLRVPDLGASGLTFEGARMLVIEGAPVAQLMYVAANGDRFALCVGASSVANAESGSLVREGNSLSGQTRGGFVYIVAGPDGRSGLVGALASDMPSLVGAI